MVRLRPLRLQRSRGPYLLLVAILVLGGCTADRPAGSTRITSTGESNPASPTDKNWLPDIAAVSGIHESPLEVDSVEASATEAVPPIPPESKKSRTRSLDELLLFLPTKVAPEAAPALPPGIESVWIKSADGIRLNAWLADHSAPVADVLFLHGNGGNVWGAAGFVRWLQSDAGCRVLALDYRGYGLSEGVPTVEGAIADGRAARAWLAERTQQAETRIVLAGHSLGGAIAVQLSREVEPRGLVLQSTFSSIKDVGRHHYGWLAGVIPRDRLNSVAALQNYRGSMFQSHGDADPVIPLEFGERLHAAAHGPKSFLRLAGADHNRVLTPEYLTQLAAYLHQLP